MILLLKSTSKNRKMSGAVTPKPPKRFPISYNTTHYHDLSPCPLPDFYVSLPALNRQAFWAGMPSAPGLVLPSTLLLLWSQRPALPTALALLLFANLMRMLKRALKNSLLGTLGVNGWRGQVIWGCRRRVDWDRSVSSIGIGHQTDSRVTNRYEKEFDAVQDVFELQVWDNSGPAGIQLGRSQKAWLTVYLVAKPQQCLCLRSRPISISIDRSVESGKTC